MTGFVREQVKKRFARSKGWRKLRKQHLKKQDRCVICGRKWNRQVHHIYPVHLYPDLELDPGNLVTLCGRCHLLFGHLNNWRRWNDELMRDIQVWSVKIGGKTSVR